MDRKMIDEAVNRNFNLALKENIVDEKKKTSSKSSGSKSKANKKKLKNKIKRARVILWLKDKSVNCAEIMRLLWHPSKKKEDSARSYFYKCRDNKLNDSGDEYSFTDSDITRLYSIRNGKS